MKAHRWQTLGATLTAAAVLLAGCTDSRKARLEGARAALAALPDVEVVAADDAAGVLTVRSRSTGELTTIDLGRRAAATPQGTAGTGSAAPTDGRAAAAGGASTGSAATGAAMGAGGPDAPPDATGDATDPGAPSTASPDAAAEPGTLATAETVAAASAEAPVVVRDPQGRVQVIEGEGFRIERAPAARSRPAGGATAATRAPATPAGELRRVSAPVVCGAGETRSLQGLLIDVPGAGIVAERGCTLTVANVRVRSGGWGLVVNPGAAVRIDDSVVEGRSGSLDLHPGGSLSAWATTFRGALGRPATPPQFVDRGGNSWQ